MTQVLAESNSSAVAEFASGQEEADLAAAIAASLNECSSAGGSAQQPSLYGGDLYDMRHPPSSNPASSNPTGYTSRAVPAAPGYSAAPASQQPSGDSMAEEEAMRRAIAASLADCTPSSSSPPAAPAAYPAHAGHPIAQQHQPAPPAPPAQTYQPVTRQPVNPPSAAAAGEVMPTSAGAGWAGLQAQLQGLPTVPASTPAQPVVAQAETAVQSSPVQSPSSAQRILQHQQMAGLRPPEPSMAQPHSSSVAPAGYQPATGQYAQAQYAMAQPGQPQPPPMLAQPVVAQPIAAAPAPQPMAPPASPVAPEPSKPPSLETDFERTIRLIEEANQKRAATGGANGYGPGHP